MLAEGDGIVLEIARGDLEQAGRGIDRLLGHGRALRSWIPFNRLFARSLGMIPIVGYSTSMDQ
jgi:hypothetical protein